MKKYELTAETKILDGVTLHRIKALIDVRNGVKAGDLGGWVESEGNLSHEGSCWIADEAVVSGDAIVRDYAVVRGKAVVSGDAIVRGKAVVSGNAVVSDYAVVCGTVRVFGDATVDTGLINSGLIIDYPRGLGRKLLDDDWRSSKCTCDICGRFARGGVLYGDYCIDCLHRELTPDTFVDYCEWGWRDGRASPLDYMMAYILSGEDCDYIVSHDVHASNVAEYKLLSGNVAESSTDVQDTFERILEDFTFLDDGDSEKHFAMWLDT